MFNFFITMNAEEDRDVWPESVRIFLFIWTDVALQELTEHTPGTLEESLGEGNVI